MRLRERDREIWGEREREWKRERDTVKRTERPIHKERETEREIQSGKGENEREGDEGRSRPNHKIKKASEKYRGPLGQHIGRDLE